MYSFVLKVYIVKRLDEKKPLEMSGFYLITHLLND